MIRCSVIVVTHQSAALIAGCLEAIQMQLTTADELIVVDNGSIDGTPVIVAQQFPRARLILQHNRGFAAGVNRGLAVSHGKYVLLVNPDVLLESDTITLMVAWAERHPQAGVIGGQLINRFGRPQATWGAMPNWRTEVMHTAQLHRVLPGGRYTPYSHLTSWQYQQRPVDWVSGGLMLLRQAVVRHIGQFDERFFMYLEDVDFCARARRAGWQVWYLPTVQAVHAHGASWHGNKAAARAAEQASLLKFWHKHNRLMWPLRLLIACQSGWRYLAGRT